MAEVEFLYNGTKTIIQCKETDILSSIIQQFLLKSQKNIENIYFLYNGKVLNKNVSFSEEANNHDKQRKKMNIIVNDKDTNIEIDNNSYIKTKYVICRTCKGNINLSLDDFLISLKDCKNEHVIENMSLDDFEKTQYIDETKIICDNCKKVNKTITYKNQFFICYKCNMNLCPLCKNSHNKNHYISDYEDKDYTCSNHKDIYVSYCKDCKKDICTLCQKDHNKHNLISYGNIIPDTSGFEKDLKETKESIERYKKKIKTIITKLNILIEDLDKYYNIYENLLNNFDIRKRNYSIIQNINYIINYNNIHIKDLKKGIKTKLDEIIDIALYQKNGPILIFDDGNIIIHIVKKNLIIQYVDKEICFMTTELTDKDDVSKFELFINNVRHLNSDINQFYHLFKKDIKKYIDNFVNFLNKKGDSATSEMDMDEGKDFYCLITQKSIRQIYELNQIY